MLAWPAAGLSGISLGSRAPCSCGLLYSQLCLPSPTCLSSSLVAIIQPRMTAWVNNVKPAYYFPWFLERRQAQSRRTVGDWTGMTILCGFVAGSKPVLHTTTSPFPLSLPFPLPFPPTILLLPVSPSPRHARMCVYYLPFSPPACMLCHNTFCCLCVGFAFGTGLETRQAGQTA